MDTIQFVLGARNIWSWPLMRKVMQQYCSWKRPDECPHVAECDHTLTAAGTSTGGNPLFGGFRWWARGHCMEARLTPEQRAALRVVFSRAVQDGRPGGTLPRAPRAAVQLLGAGHGRDVHPRRPRPRTSRPPRCPRPAPSTACRNGCCHASSGWTPRAWCLIALRDAPAPHPSRQPFRRGAGRLPLRPHPEGHGRPRLTVRRAAVPPHGRRVLASP